jgi:hypothetical protein
LRQSLAHETDLLERRRRRLDGLSRQAERPTEVVEVIARGGWVAMIRLGRAYEAIGSIQQAEKLLRDAVAVNPGNPIAIRRLRDLERRRR